MSQHELTTRAAGADGFYFPDDGGARAPRVPQGHLGARAKRLHEGVLVVRFEMMYPGFCTRCGAAVAQGVRFDADKRRVGMDAGVPRYEFRMTCMECKNPFVIRTNPSGGDYDFVSGVRRRAQTADTADTGGRDLGSLEERGVRKALPFARVEDARSDARRAADAEESLHTLMRVAEREKDGVTAHWDLRRAFRADRHARERRKKEMDSRGLVEELTDGVHLEDHELAEAALAPAGSKRSRSPADSLKRLRKTAQRRRLTRKLPLRVRPALAATAPPAAALVSAYASDDDEEEEDQEEQEGEGEEGTAEKRE